jgi:peptidylprolyl isomerase
VKIGLPMKRKLLFLIFIGSLVGVAAGCHNAGGSQKTNAKLAPQIPEVTVPPGVPPVAGETHTLFTLRYQDIAIGTGAEAEPGKIYKVLYTGWLAADGKKFDSSYDHRTPVMGPDGKAELDVSGKPKMGDPQPITVPQGFGRVIPGFDQGFSGMKVGGKRRLFIPWQLAYGARGRPPVIPPKSDLIFDIELVDVSDLQMPSGHPAMPGMGGMPAGHPPIGQPGPPASPTTPPPADKPQIKQ